MTTIAAKPTLYNGTRFRSRLEARWAAFFDAIGREWIYEPDLPELGPVQYQPDFLTTKSHGEGLTIIEVKPDLEADQTIKLLRDERWHRVANLTKCNFVILFGTPGKWLEGQVVDVGHYGAQWVPDQEPVHHVEFAECLICDQVNIYRDGVATCHRPPPTGAMLRAFGAVRDTSFGDAQ